MRNYAILVPVLIFFCITACLSDGEKTSDELMPASINVVSLHLYDTSMNVTDAELMGWLEEINAAIEEIGYPGAGYKFWKAIDETVMQNRYMILSSWPDEEAYQLIHDHEAYKAVNEKYSELGEKITKQSLYVRYQLVD